MDDPIWVHVSKIAPRESNRKLDESHIVDVWYRKRAFASSPAGPSNACRETRFALTNDDERINVLGFILNSQFDFLTFLKIQFYDMFKWLESLPFKPRKFILALLVVALIRAPTQLIQG